MARFDYKKTLPYIAIIAIFAAITLVYFSPLLAGKKLVQPDIAHFKGMAKEIQDYRTQTGEEALWTNSMFGGMPAYQISVIYKGNILRYVDQAMQLYLPQPAGMFFLYLIGFFILLMVLKVDKWLAMAGSIAFAFSAYFLIIIGAGHNSKAHAIGYMAPVLAGIILAYRGKYVWGGILTAIFLSLEILTNHLQITYYLALTCIIFVAVQLIYDIKKHNLPNFAKSTGILVIAAIFAVLTNITNLWATYEYGKYTIRGKSELSSEKENRTSGLDKDYATDYSYGIGESFNLLIPNYKGGASVGSLSEKSNSYNALINNGVEQSQAKQAIQRLPLYWGTQPQVAGPSYIGAIIIFLFVFALFTTQGKLKWWLIAATILSILLAWGKNFMPFTNFFMHYIPGYNKFRAVSMTLVIAELAIPLLGVLGISNILKKQHEEKYLLKSLLYSVIITGGFCLFVALFGGSLFNFTSPNDSRYGFPEWLTAAIQQDRAVMLRNDAWRSLVFVLLGAGILWLYIKEKIKQNVLISALAIFIILDLWSVNKRYLNNDNFERKNLVENPYQPSNADQLIMKDVDPNFRVFNTTVDPFNDASTSYFHKSIGGYHGAKLRRYQELIERHLATGNMNVFNMLNTKYFISMDRQTNQPTLHPNMTALGNAWFVNEVRRTENADQEIAALSNFIPAETAVYDKRFDDMVKGHNFTKDSTAKIDLIGYKPNHLTYQSQANSEQLAVFSEIYYDKGWNAYIDGKEAPYFRADYVLRAMFVPAGAHKIDFKFEPKVYKTGEKISYASSILLILIILGFIGYQFIYKKNQEDIAENAQ